MECLAEGSDCCGRCGGLNKEIFTQGSGNPVADDEVFGYQERFAEMRYRPSQISGKFRSNDPVTLDSWHLSQDFASLPFLGGRGLDLGQLRGGQRPPIGERSGPFRAGSA